MLDVGPHGPGEHGDLEVAALAAQVVDVVAMAHPDHVLVDDRALVEVGGDVVGGHADQLDAALVRLVVGAGAAERRQERVVDVDRPACPRVAERRGEHLHVAGEHDEVDSVLGEGGGDEGLLGGLVAIDDREVAVVDTEPRGHLGVVGVVADHHRNVDRQLAAAAAVEEVVEAV